MCFRHCGRSGRRVEDCCGTHDSGLYRQDLSAARSSSVGSCMPTTTCDDLAQLLPGRLVDRLSAPLPGAPDERDAARAVRGAEPNRCHRRRSPAASGPPSVPERPIDYGQRSAAAAWPRPDCLADRRASALSGRLPRTVGDRRATPRPLVGCPGPAQRRRPARCLGAHPGAARLLRAWDPALDDTLRLARASGSITQRPTAARNCQSREREW